MKFDPATIIPWLTVIAQLISLGKTTYEEIASLFAGSHTATDVETAVADNATLLMLRGLIADSREKARIEAGLDPTP